MSTTAEILGGSPWWVEAFHAPPPVPPHQPFQLASVTVPTAATLAVRFNQVPLQSSHTGAHDALNIANYTLTGPTLAVIASAATDPSDAQTIVLTLSGPMGAGTWVLAVANVQTPPPGNYVLVAPFFKSFVVTPAAMPPPVNPGLVDTEPEDFLRIFLSKALKGPGWTALIDAVATGDRTNWDNAESAFDQLFISSASEQFLDRRLSDDGTERPPGIGLSDDLFRQLGITIRTNQLTQEAFLEVLEIFYGTDAVRAYTETSVGGPFDLSDGDDLQLLVDGIDAIPITFQAGDFALISKASALEVAVAITRGIRVLGNSQAFAVPLTNAQTGVSTVRIYSGAIGLRSTIQVTGGKSQNSLLFPEQLPLPSGNPTPSSLTWDVNVVVGSNVPQAPPNVMRVYLASGNSNFDLTQVHAGDYVNIFGSGFLNDPSHLPSPQVNRGSFKVLNVFVGYDSTGTTLYQYFDVENHAVAQQTGVAQTTLDDVRFYRSIKATIQAKSGRTVVVSQSTPDVCDVVIPTTTLAVTRTIDTAAYLHVAPPLTNSIAPSPWQIVRTPGGVVTVSNAPMHGLHGPSGSMSGSQIFVDNIVPSKAIPTPVAGTPGSSGIPGMTSASPVSLVSLIREGDQVPTANYSASIALLNTGTTASDPVLAILQTGGNVGGTTVGTCEQLQFQTPAALLANGGYQWTYNWVATTALPAPLERHAIVTPTQGNNIGGAVVAGGVNITSGPTLNFSTAIYTFNAVAPNSYIPPPAYPGLWSTAAISLTTATASLTAQLLANGQMVIAGGAVAASAANVNAAATASAYFTDANQATITPGPNLNRARAEHQAVTFINPQGVSTTMVIGGRTLAVAAPVDALTLALWHLDTTTGGGGGGSPESTPFGGHGPGHTYTPTLSPAPVQPGTGVFKIVSGVTLATDNGAGSWVGSGITGTINYTTGVCSITVSADETSHNLEIDWTTAGAPGTTPDAGPNGYTLTLSSQVLYNNGKINKAMDFSGAHSGDLSGAGSATAVTALTGSFAIEAWVGNLQNVSGTPQTILAYEGTAGSSTGNILVRFQATYTASVGVTLSAIWQTGTNANVPTMSAGPFPYDTTIPWHHVAMTKNLNANGVGYDVQFYLDGVPVGAPVLNNTNATDGSAATWNLGDNVQTPLYPFGGQLDDVRVSAGRPAYFLSTAGSQLARTPQDIYATWLAGRGDYLTPGNGQLLASTETFTQGGGAWVKTGKMTMSRSGHQAVVLGDGRVLVTGGYAYKNGQVTTPTSALGVWSPTDSAELYDPRTGVWTQAGFMSSPRADHMAVYVPETNSVLVFGGYRDAIGTPAAPVYDRWDAATGLWTTGVHAHPHHPHHPHLHLTEFTAVPVTYGGSTIVWLAGAPGMVYVQGSDQLSGGGLEGWQTVTHVIDANTFQYETLGFPQYTQNVGTQTVITPFAAPPAGKVPGPYVWDTAGLTPGITSIQSSTAVALYRGQQYETLQLSSDVASSFPPGPGYLVLNFGSSEAVYPVPYLGLFSADALTLDYTFVMPFDVPAGASVTLISGKGVYVPQTPEAVGSFYLTDSNAGRIDAEGIIEDISAGGLDVDITIVYPGDRGLGGEALGATGQKFSDKVLVWGSNDLNVDETDARLGINLQVSGEEF